MWWRKGTDSNSNSSLPPASEGGAPLAPAAEASQAICDMNDAEVEAIFQDPAAVFHSANAIVIGIDSSGHVRLWNHKAIEVTGWNAEEVHGKRFVDTYVTPSFKAEAAEILRVTIQGGESVNKRIMVLANGDGGPERELLMSVAPLHGVGEGDPQVGAICIGFDATDLDPFQDITEASSLTEDMKRVVDTASTPFFFTDTKLQITEWNQAAVRLSGISREDLVGKSAEVLLQQEHRADFKKMIYEVMEGQELTSRELPFLTETGEQMCVLVNLTARRSSKGELMGVIGVGQDVTAYNKLMVAQQTVLDDLRRLIETANAPIFGVDVEGRVTEWNHMAASLSGFSKDETMGRFLVDEFITSEYKSCVAEVISRACRGEETANFEFPLMTKQGTRVEVLLNATARRDANGCVTGMVGVGQDITALRKVTAEQQTLVDDLQRLIETANAPIFGVDAKGRVTEWNSMAAQLSGFSKQETMGKLLVDEFITAEYKMQVASVLARAFQGEDTANFEFPLVTKSGDRIVILLNAASRLSANGDVIGAVGVGQDITNLRQAMSESDRVADDMRRIIDEANAPILGIDKQGLVNEWNQMAVTITGYTKEEALGKHLIEQFSAGNSKDELRQVFKVALAGLHVGTSEVTLLSKDVGCREILLNATTRRSADGEVTGVIGVGQDITELRKVTAEHQFVAADLRRLIESANAPIFGVDVGGHVTEWNRMAASLSGFSKEETMGHQLVQEFITEDYKREVAFVLARACAGEETANFEFPLITKHGTRVDILLNATPRRDAEGVVVGVVGVGQDITNLRQEMIRSAQVADDLTRLIDKANAPIFGIDTMGCVTEWNSMAACISQWSKEETLGQPLVETFITEHYREEVGRILQSALQGNETANYEFPLFTKDGRRREILLNATARRGASGEVTGVIGVGQDITELRKVAAEQQYLAADLQRLIETANAPIFGVDVEGRVTEWNRMAAELSGYPKDETLGRCLVEDFITPDYQAKVAEVLARACQGNETANFEFPLVTKTGTRIEVLLNATPRRDSNGNVTGVVGVGQDITSLRQAMSESARVADDLTRLIDTANAPIFGIDTHGLVTEWNQMATELSGYTKEETLGKALVEQFIAQSYREEVGQVLSKALQGIEMANFEFPLFTKDGRRREILLNATSRRAADGVINGVIGVGQDISELRKVTVEQQMVAEDLQRLIESANAPIFGVDTEGCVNEWNRMAARLSGYPKEETMGQKLVGFITESYRKDVSHVLARALAGIETANFEFPLMTKTFERFEVLLNATPRRDADGHVIGVVGVGQDITNLRQAMVRSAQIADDLMRVIDTANAPIFGIDVEGRVTEWNCMAMRISQWTKEQTMGKPLVSTFITESYRAEVERVLRNALEGNETLNFEFPLFTKDGSRREILLNATTRRGSDGQVVGVIGVGQDITDLRKITAEQKSLADDLQRLIDTANAPIFGTDVQGRVTEWNRHAASLSGFSKEETMGQTLVEQFITAEYRAQVSAVLTRACMGEETANFEFPLVTKTGKRIELLLNATTRRAADGSITGTVGVGQDITSLRQAMAVKAFVADDLTRVIDTANAPIFGIDTAGLVTEWNQMSTAISGWTKKETLGKPLVETFITERYREEVGRVLTSALLGNETANYEFPLFTKDGRRREILLNATTRRGAEGDVTGVIGVGQDITELRAATAEQQRVADDLQRLIETANAPIFGVDTEGNVTEWNRMAATLSEYSKEESLGTHLVTDFITAKYRDDVSKVLTRALSGEVTDNFEFPLIAKSGTRVELLLNATPIRDAQGHVIGMIGVGQDITKMRQAMVQTTQVAEDLTRVIDTANAPIFGINKAGEVTEWNRMAASISQWSKEETLGKLLVENFIHESYRKEVGDVLKDALEGNESANYEFPLFTKDGRRREILLNATTRRSADGEVTGVIGVGQDITELRNVTAAQANVLDDLTRLIDTAHAPIFGVDVEGRVTEWNRMAAQLSEFSREETMGKFLVDEFITAEYRSLVSTVLARACEGEDTANFEFPLISKRGKRIDVLLNATARRDANGCVIGVVGVGQDITNLRQAMQHSVNVAEDLTRVIDTANAPIFGIDTMGLVVEWNRMAAQVSGWTKEESLGKPLVETFISESYRGEVFRVLKDALQGNDTANFEFPLFSRDGMRREILLNATARKEKDGKVSGVIGVGQDITQLRQVLAEQQQVAEDLQRFIETANAPIFGVNRDGQVTEWNSMAAQLSGFSKKDTMGQLLKDFITDDYKDEVAAVLARALQGNETANFQFPLISKNKQRVDILLNATTRRNDKGEVVGVVGVGQDISSHSRAFEETKTVAEDLMRLIDTANAPIFGIDPNGCVNEWNRKAVEISGWEKDETYGKLLVANFVPEVERYGVQQVLSNALENDGDSANYEFPLCTKDGQRREILLNATARKNAKGEIIGVLGVGQDITELNVQRRNAASIADDLSRLIDTANAPIFGVDKQSKVTVWNKKVAELSGFPYESVIGKPLVQNFITEENRDQVAFVLLRALGGETVPNFEIALFGQAGKRCEVLMNAMPRCGPDGSVIGVIGVGHDITEMRRVTAEQKREAKDMATLIRCANAIIFGVDIQGRLIEWNNKAMQMTGYTKEEVAGQSLVDYFVADDSKELVQSMLDKANRGFEDMGEFEFRILSKDGRYVLLTMSIATFRDVSGKMAGMVACGQDITRMKDTMLEMSHLAQDLTRVVNTANAPIFGMDTFGNVNEWNRKTEEISGFSREEALGKPLVSTFISEAWREQVNAVLQNALEGTDTANYEFPLFTLGGRRREILLNATTRRGADGEVTGVIGVGQDITDLRYAMQEHEHTAQSWSRFIESANAPIFGVDKAGCVTIWNRKAAELSGFSKEETLGRQLVTEFITHDCWKKVDSVLQRALGGEETANFEFPLVTKDGQQIEILLNATPCRDAHDQITTVVGVGQDITVMRQAMIHSKQVAEDLTRLIDTANAPILGIDEHGLVTEWNRKAAEISGWSKTETMGKPLVKTFITEHYRNEVWYVLQLALDGQESANYEFPLFTKSGMRRDILLNATSRRGADGTIVGVIGVGQDITELRALMRESQLVADDLQRLIETANAPIFGVDVHGCVNEWNRKAAMITGFSRRETLAKPFVKDFIDEAHQTSVYHVLERALKGDEVGNFTLPLYSKGGDMRIILLNATPRCDVDGNVIGAVGVGQDITELNQQKSEALRTASELQNIIDTAGAPIISVDRDWRVTSWNCRVMELTGYGKEQAMGKDFLSYIVEGCRAETHRALQRAFEGHSTGNFEVLVSTTSQKHIVLLLSVAPRMDPNKVIVGVICIGQDITQMKELEIKKSQFAATVTHELRSPLHGIIGLSENLLEEAKDGPIARSLHMINNCSRRLVDLVTNIMDLSTLVERKKMRLSRDPVHVAKLIDDVLMLTSNAEDKAGRPIQKSAVKLVKKLPPNLPIIEADAHRCMQMLYNLVTNALKFTERGEVKVSATANDKKQVLTIAVSDTGIGIMPQCKDLIFQPFEQEDQSESRRFEGLGLGLSISKEICVKHGGSLTVESESGKGSTFHVTLPYKPFTFAGEPQKVLENDGDVEIGTVRANVESELRMMQKTNAEKRRAVQGTSSVCVVERTLTHGDEGRFAQQESGLQGSGLAADHHSVPLSHAVVTSLDEGSCEELLQLRVLLPGLQRQNQHLHVTVSHLQERLLLLESESNHLRLQASMADTMRAEAQLQASHAALDCQFFLSSSNSTAFPNLPFSSSSTLISGGPNGGLGGGLGGGLSSGLSGGLSAPLATDFSGGMNSMGGLGSFVGLDI